MSAVIAARHGRCEACSGEIIPGQLIVCVDDEWVHLECELWALRRAATADVCPTCFLLRPCPCEDGQ